MRPSKLLQLARINLRKPRQRRAQTSMRLDGRIGTPTISPPRIFTRIAPGFRSQRIRSRRGRHAIFLSHRSLAWLKALLVDGLSHRHGDGLKNRDLPVNSQDLNLWVWCS